MTQTPTTAPATSATGAAAPAAEGAAQKLPRFQARRRELVTSPQGSLALTNTQWVDSEQPIYGVPGRWAPAPEGQSGLKVIATAADGIRVDGELVDGEAIVRGKDDPAPGDIDFGGGVTGFVIGGENGSYALRVFDADSEAIQHFGRIDAFDYNPDWVVQGVFTEHPEGSTLGFEHTKDDGATREELVPGVVSFTHDGTDYELVAIKSGKALQLVFSDATSGDSTYSVGRFLFVAPNADGSITLDFNFAVLPPCAFSYAFNCPMPPKQNRFTVPIEAGEKNVLAADGSMLH